MERTSVTTTQEEATVHSLDSARVRQVGAGKAVPAPESDFDRNYADVLISDRSLAGTTPELKRFGLDVWVTWLLYPNPRGFSSIGALLSEHVSFERLVLVIGDAGSRRVFSIPEMDNVPPSMLNEGTVFPLERRDRIRVGYLDVSCKRPLNDSETRLFRLTAAAIVGAMGERERASARNQRMGGRSRGADALGRREREVAEFVGLGLTNMEIAARMGISPFTVANHLRHVYRKLQVSNRAEMVRLLMSGQ